MTIKTLLFCLSSLVCVPAATAQDTATLIEKNLEARGGIDNLRAVETLVKVGTISLPDADYDLAVTTSMKRPDMWHSEVLYGEDAVEVVVFDGEQGWVWVEGELERSLGTGPVVGSMSEAVVARYRKLADFDGPFVDPAEKGYEIEYVGRADVRGRPAYKLKVTDAQGQASVIYLDAETYLTSRVEAETVTAYISDYREVGGVLLAHRSEVYVDGQEEPIVNVERFQVNVALSDELFAKPD